MTYANGDVYEGDWFDGNHNGKGKYTWANGDVYVGDFVDNHFHGKGKMTCADGTIKEGRFEHSEFEGDSAVAASKAAAISKSAYKISVEGCLLCGSCEESCNNGAIFNIDGKYWLDPTKCNKCGDCVDSCLAGIITLKN